jgi:hypothetical protein
MEEEVKASIAILDSALIYLQEANKRLARLLALALIIIAFLLGSILYLL